MRIAAPSTSELPGESRRLPDALRHGVQRRLHTPPRRPAHPLRHDPRRGRGEPAKHLVPEADLARWKKLITGARLHLD